MPRSLPLALPLPSVRGSRMVEGLQRGVERGIEIAGVVSHDHRRLVREFPDEVLAAQFHRAHALNCLAATSIMRSTTKPASGRPAPR